MCDFLQYMAGLFQHALTKCYVFQRFSLASHIAFYHLKQGISSLSNLFCPSLLLKCGHLSRTRFSQNRTGRGSENRAALLLWYSALESWSLYFFPVVYHSCGFAPEHICESSIPLWDCSLITIIHGYRNTVCCFPVSVPHAELKFTCRQWVIAPYTTEIPPEARLPWCH